MSDLEPVVRHMLLCDDVQTDPDNPRKVNVFGLVGAIRPSRFPARLPELCVYLALTGGRGSGEVRVVAVHADSDSPAFASPAYRISFGPNPLTVRGVVFRLRDCVFTHPGLYWIEFRYNGRMIARQPLLVE